MDHGAGVASFAAETGFRRMRAVRGFLAAMLADERSLLDARDAAQRSGLQTFWIVLVASGVLPAGVPVHAVDANAAWARPGTRLVDGVEELAAILHPEGAGRSALEPDG